MGYGLMRILVTGAGGYLGSHIVAVLSKMDITVIASGRQQAEGMLACDLASLYEAKALVLETTPDCIIHCAAHVPKGTDEYDDKRSAEISVAMLDTLLKVSTCKVVYVSSMSVYGDRTICHASENDPMCPASEYAKGKSNGEERLRLDGRPGFAVRIPGLFGLPRRSGIVYNILNSLKNKEPCELPNAPVVWAAMHITDAAECIANIAMININCFEIVNIGYREKYSISKLIKLVGDIYQRDVIYNVIHPVFEFDLSRAAQFNAIPTRDLHQALIDFGSEI